MTSKFPNPFDVLIILLGVFLSIIYVTIAFMIVIYTIEKGYPIELVIASILSIIGAIYIPYECIINTKDYYDNYRD